jgi:hypothetical protein
MLGISNEVWGAVGTVAGAVAAVAVPITGWAFSILRAKHVAELGEIRKDAAADLEKVRLEIISSIKDVVNDVVAQEKQIELNVASLKAAWLVLDDLRINGVRKADQDRLRDELKQDFSKMREELLGAIKDLKNDIHNNQRGGA